jgi:site-specific DNA-methyltransferase (adenine-specific)
LFDIICWHKTNALPTYSNKYLTDTEYLLYFHKGKGKCFPQSYEDAKTFYLAPINHEDKKKYQHPTIKPLDLTEKIIRNSSNENDTILDCFMGSGTTGVACKRLKRNFIGVEIDKEYFNIASKRIENADKIKKLF